VHHGPEAPCKNPAKLKEFESTKEFKLSVLQELDVKPASEICREHDYYDKTGNLMACECNVCCANRYYANHSNDKNMNIE